MTEELRIEGKVKKVETKHRETKDMSMELAEITIGNDHSDRVRIQGDTNIADGFNPEDHVCVIIKRTQKTIAESVAEEKKLKKK